MSNNLVIVESPSKATTIKKYLGKDFDVIASQGHIIDLPSSKFGVDVDNNYKAEYITMKGKASIIKEIKEKAKKADKVYIATDPDREGEAIAWHIRNTLKIKPNEKCRIEFNEITKDAVNSAIKKPRLVDEALVNAQQARRILDRIVGYKISPVLWKKVKKGLSAGRVQSVAMRIIMDREREIRDFKPEEYWLIDVELLKDDKKLIAKFYGKNGKKVDLTNKSQVDKIIKVIDKKEYKVVDVKKSEKKRNPAPPFTTSTLQQDASRKLGFSVKKTMMVAQKLYESGYITYMRTDSVRISDDARKMAKNYIEEIYGKNYHEDRFYKTKKDAQDAHEAIRPSDLSKIHEVEEKCTPDEKKLYNLIKNRFLASLMTSAVYDTTKVTIDVEDYDFIANGSIIKFDGFMALYNIVSDEEEEEENAKLPDINVGDILKQNKLTPSQKFTEPPARYNEASLVKILEEKGIGRPSTYAPTISTLLDRVYIEKENKALVPTELGEIVDNLMENNFQDIVDISFTAEMEEKLDEEAENNIDYVKMLDEFYKPFIKNLKNVEDKIEKVKIPEVESDVKCELCGRNMVIKQGRFGKFLACPGYPECKNVKSIVETVDIPCPKCGGKVLVKKTKTHRTFYVCENNSNSEDSKCDYISWSKPKKN